MSLDQIESAYLTVALMLVAGKLFGVLPWSWWIVSAPIALPVAVVAVVLIAAGVSMLLDYATAKETGQ